MRIQLETVSASPGGRLPIAGEIDFGFVDLGRGQRFITPVGVQGAISKRADVLTLDYNARFTLLLSCDRCLAWVERDFEMNFSHVLTLLKPEEDSEAIFCPDGQLDMATLCVDDVLTSLPRRTLCHPDCKGLCPECGASLNSEDCGHRQQSGDRPDGDPRWAALKNLNLGDEN